MDLFKGKKLNLHANFPKLNKVRESLGIDSKQIKIAQFISSGSISLDTQEEFDRFVKFAPNKLNNIILIAGQVAVIYIKDNSNRRSSENEDLTKVHLTECRTIQDMKIKKRFHRYIGVKDVSSDKKFSVTLSTQQTRAQLHICKNCLNQLDMEKSNKNITDFDYENHIRKYTQKLNSLLAYYDDYNTPDYLYPSDWSKISHDIKRRNHYICHTCGVDLSHNDKLLDVHHKDSDKSNINTLNLECLCKSCHSKIHPHYKQLVSNEINLINKIKIQQGL